jgi:glucose/arabinose dehydrogenase
MDFDRVARRQVLGASSGLVVSLAGCLDRLDPRGTGSDDDGDPDGDGTPSETDESDETDTPADSIEDLALAGELVDEGFSSPIAVVPTPDGDYLVADQMGTVSRVDGADGTTEEFLDVTDRMVSIDGYSEQGLLGLTLHPDFESNGRCFVRYSAPSSSGSSRANPSREEESEGRQGDGWGPGIGSVR